MATDSLALAEAGTQSAPEPVLVSYAPEREHRHAGIELRDLRYFLGLAEELHFGRAAARLYITQPGLSQAVARLEQVLDVKLFTRTHRNVELTEAGKELVHRVRRLLADHDEAINRVRSVGRGEVAVIRLGVATLSDPIVAPALNAFQLEYPRTPLDHSVALSERLLDQVQAGGLDAALVHQVPGLASAANIDWEPLRRGRLAVIVSPTSKFARSEIVTLGDLRNETFLVNPRSLAPEAYEGFKLMCRQFGGFDAKVLESSALRMFVPATEGCAIAEGAALAIVPEETARMAPTGLAVVPLQAPPQYVIALAWRQGEPAPQVRQFIDYLRSYRDEHGW